MTQLVRIPWAWPIGTRSGFSLAKDPYIKNGMLEKYGDKLYVYKRPGTMNSVTFGTGGTTQGAFYFNGFFYVIVDDVLYRSSGGANAGTDGTAWTQITAPTFPVVEGQGGVVFKGRMWVIGGAPSAGTGIWSTQDGITWAVNAGGQPWGFRSNMGCVVFQNQMWVLGGLNLTLNSTFNDVWSTGDGTNWTQISPDTGALSMWNTRYRHCAVASNNGMYIYGGKSAAAGTTYDDIWYTADGITWQQLNTAATGTARAGASMLYYKGEIYIIGGQDSSGTALNDVWSSPDGITWTNRTMAAFGGGGRYNCYSYVYRDVMWIMGGQLPAATNQVYVSNSNGTTWFLDAGPTGLTARSNGVGLVFKTPPTVSQYQYETLWALGGDTGFTPVAEVWYGDINAPLNTTYPLNPGTVQEQYDFATYNNGTQLLFKNSSNFYVLSGSSLTTITDPNYPPVTARGIAVLNAFAYVVTPSAEVHACQLGDATVWPSLQFLTADYEDDPAECIIKYLNYVVVFGQYTIQFFYDNGANQPVGIALAPYINANLRVGTDDASTVSIVGNNVFWVTQDNNGQRTVAMFNGLTPQKVSSPYVDRILMAGSNGPGFPASANGHLFYVLKTGTFSALVYDTVYQEWYEWDNFPYGFYVTNFTTGGDYLVSTSGGNMVNFTPLSGTDVLLGDFDLVCQTDKVDHGNMARKFCGRVTMVGDKSAATPTIQFSDDDYATYTTLGTVDMTSDRPNLVRSGSFRRRSWRVIQTDGNTARWEALEVEYSQGES